MLLALASLLACVALRREAAAPPAAATAYGNLPLAFEANEGQLPGEVRFASRADRRVVEVLEDGLRLRGTTGAALRFRMGAPAKPAAVRGQRPLAGRVHYLKGRDPRHWKRGIRTYGAVRRDAAYPGVDLVYYGRGQELEYDFIVAPGADPAAIRVAVQGTASASIDPSGDLVLADATGEVRQRRPIAYQERGGQREPVEVAYALQETAAPGAVEFGLQLGAYDRSLPLVVDPVLVYGTYFGGSGADLSLGGGIAVDAAGSAYVTGETASTDLPGATSPRPGGFRDAFVTKLNPAGTGAVYTTYVGGSDSDTARSIAVDAEGGACITGDTFSRDFPTVNPIQNQLAGFPSSDAFVARLDPTGSSLVFATFLGGGSSDAGRGVALDSLGSVWVTGATSSADFPVRSGVAALPGGGFDAFVACLSAGGTELLSSTFLGGSENDRGAGIAVGPDDTVAVCGSTESVDFPVRNAVQPVKRFGRDGFVTRLTAGGGAIDFSTFLGSNSSDAATGVAVDPSSSVCVTGFAGAGDFPSQNPGQARIAGRSDAFVTRFTPAGSALVYSTLLGGSGTENNGIRETGAIAVDASGSAFVTGFTDSRNFPAVGALQPKPGKRQDAFVTRLSPTGGPWVYSTYLGGTGDDAGLGIALDADGNAYVAGATTSRNLPLRNPAQRTPASGEDGFIAKVGVVNAATTPILVLPATTVEFGTINVGRTAVKPFKITNGGQGRLVCAVSGFAEPFHLLAGEETVTVAKRKSKSLFLQFSPTEPGEFNVPLTIETNDPYYPVAVIQLHGVCPEPAE